MTDFRRSALASADFARTAFPSCPEGHAGKSLQVAFVVVSLNNPRESPAHYPFALLLVCPSHGQKDIQSLTVALATTASDVVVAIGAHRYKSLLVYCCLASQFFAYAVLIRREYYQPYPDDQRGARMKSLKRTMFIVCLISWIGIAVARWAL